MADSLIPLVSLTLIVGIAVGVQHLVDYYTPSANLESIPEDHSFDKSNRDAA